MDTNTQKKVAESFTERYKRQFGQTFGTANLESETLTFEKVLACYLGLLGSGFSRINRSTLTQPLFAPQLRIITSNLLTVSTPKHLTLFERFRVWIESLADKAEIYYHYPRVQRSILKPDLKAYLLDSNTLVCHPAIYFKIRNSTDLSIS